MTTAVPFIEDPFNWWNPTANRCHTCVAVDRGRPLAECALLLVGSCDGPVGEEPQ